MPHIHTIAQDYFVLDNIFHNWMFRPNNYDLFLCHLTLNATTHDSFTTMYIKEYVCTHIGLLFNCTTYNSLAELCFISYIDMFK